MRLAFGLSTGDRLHFQGQADGTIVVELRKRRRIVDIARANAFSAGEAGLDIDAAIDVFITEAMADRERRSRRESGE